MNKAYGAYNFYHLNAGSSKAGMFRRMKIGSDLANYLGGEIIAGGKLKDIGELY
jgi:hypothetical protein